MTTATFNKSRSAVELALPWVILALCLLTLLAPTVYDLYDQFWRLDINSQGPIVLAMASWLLFRKGQEALQLGTLSLTPAPRTGTVVLVLGLLMYVIGRSQAVLVAETAAFVPILVGLSLLLLGGAFTRRLWFAFFFVLFTVPLPGSLVDALTQPLKIGVSWASEHLLHSAGYPVARAGVLLHMGPYQLLVADACAGLHSLFTLEALGLLYLNVMRHESVMRNVVLAVLIVPISFLANTLRVVTLALITYHMGDEAGQGFLHNFAGMALFLSALMLIIGVDAALRHLDRLTLKWRS